MSRVVELQDGLLRDPAYALEFARLEGDLTKLKTIVQRSARRPGTATERCKRTDANEPKARIA